MKHLRKIADFADRTARRLDLDVEQVSGFGDGSYRVEFREREEKPKPVRGFVYEPDASGDGSNTAGLRPHPVEAVPIRKGR